MEMLVLSAEECRPLRAEAGATTKYAGDDDQGAMHLAFKEGAELLAVASILPERRDARHEMWRLRGVVVAPGHRGKGLGRRLMNAVQMIVGERGGGLWCAVPAEARPFFERCGMAAADGPRRASRAGVKAATGAPTIMTWDG